MVLKDNMRKEEKSWYVYHVNNPGNRIFL